jgi:hypothetical protein
MPASLIDRRNQSRDPLYQTRRRYPRLALESCDVFYESEESVASAERLDLSLRGLFLPCLLPDQVGARGTVHIDGGGSEMIRLEVEVLRQSKVGQAGMALRIVSMSEDDRSRLAALLLREGGLAAIPQLDRSFSTLTRAPRPKHARQAA